MPDANTIVVTGVVSLTSTALWAVWRSDDRGATWTKVAGDFGADANLKGVRFINATHGVIVGRDQVLLSTNSGTSWTPVAVGGGQFEGEALAFVDPMNGIIAGRNDTTKKVVVYRTKNGGTTWDSEPLPAETTTPDAFASCAAYPGTTAYVGLTGSLKWLRDTAAGGNPPTPTDAGTSDAGTTTDAATTADAAGSDASSTTADATTADAITADATTSADSAVASDTATTPSDAAPSDSAAASDSAVGEDATPTDPGAAPAEDSGGCATGRGPARAPFALALVALGFLLRPRRVRRVRG